MHVHSAIWFCRYFTCDMVASRILSLVLFFLSVTSPLRPFCFSFRTTVVECQHSVQATTCVPVFCVKYSGQDWLMHGRTPCIHCCKTTRWSLCQN